jgi:hypothetical protein
LRQFDVASRLVQQSLQYQSVGEYNWFKVMEYKTQLAFYMQDYPLAYQTYWTVINHPVLVQMPEVIQEKWYLFEAYARLLLRLGKVERSNGRTRPFRVYKFVNSIEIFSKDKRGLNIPITIIQVCFEICNQRFDRLITRMEALDKYRSRYLNKACYLRSNIFMKMLLKLVRADFCPIKVQEKVAPHLRELRLNPYHEVTKGHELEIIPYTHLWTLLMEALQSQSGRRYST